jgi:hypothetical protein
MGGTRPARSPSDVAEHRRRCPSSSACSARTCFSIIAAGGRASAAVADAEPPRIDQARQARDEFVRAIFFDELTDFHRKGPVKLISSGACP